MNSTAHFPSYWPTFFLNACEQGHLNEAKHLCNRSIFPHSNPHVHNEVGLRMAAFNGHLNVVEFLLTSCELLELGHSFSNIHAGNDDALILACSNGHLELVQFLLTSPKILESGHSFSNIHAQDDEGFRSACCNQHSHVVQWLIFNHNIPLTPTLEIFIQSYPEVRSYFKIREEHTALLDSAPTLNSISKQSLIRI